MSQLIINFHTSFHFLRLHLASVTFSIPYAESISYPAPPKKKSVNEAQIMGRKQTDPEYDHIYVYAYK